MWYSSAYANCPRIFKSKGKLVAKSSLYQRIISLGLLNRKVVVDPARRTVTISRSRFWFFRRRRRIPFDLIRAVTYGYQDWNANSLEWGHKPEDLYEVGLRLQDRSELHLFYFYGEGEFTNQGPLPDWIYWTSFQFDTAGTQGSESRLFAETLSKILGVPIEPPSA
jgi:hypothetical protein